MLGNFSFGDYFKEAVHRLGMEFLTKTIGLDGKRMVVSIHKTDDEAFKIWSRWFPKTKLPIRRRNQLLDEGPTALRPCSESSGRARVGCGQNLCGPPATATGIWRSGTMSHAVRPFRQRQADAPAQQKH